MLRGGLLALLALALGRTTVSFQFQSVTSLAGELHFDITPSALGMLLGLYMAPGALAAIGAPVLVSRLGWRAALFLALGLMAIGQLAIVLVDSLQSAYSARFVAGVGGCVVYVLTVSFVAQLEDYGPLPRRLGIIATSWPAGNALALALLGSAVLASGVRAWAPMIFVLLAAGLIALTCRSSDRSRATQSAHYEAISLRAWWVAIRSGFSNAFSFALYNVAFILVTSFSPALLAAEGFAAPIATTVSSLPMWLFILSVPLGGVLAGRLPGHERKLVVIGCVGSALVLGLAMVTPYKTVWYVVAGLLGGLPTAPMWAGAKGRVQGSGAGPLAYPALFLVFFTSLIFFPPAVGFTVERIGEPRVALLACASMLIVACLVFLRGTRTRRR